MGIMFKRRRLFVIPAIPVIIAILSKHENINKIHVGILLLALKTHECGVDRVRQHMKYSMCVEGQGCYASSNEILSLPASSSNMNSCSLVMS